MTNTREQFKKNSWGINVCERLFYLIGKYGERLPKKHGSWYRLRVWSDNWLLWDTWNGSVVHIIGSCESTGIDNMYHVVYTFKGRNLGRIEDFKLWTDRINQCVATEPIQTYLNRSNYEL